MIKVKPLVFEGRIPICFHKIKELQSVQIFTKEASQSNKFEVVKWKQGALECKTLAKYETLEEAQAYIQRLWDEYVMSLIEVKGEVY